MKFHFKLAVLFLAVASFSFAGTTQGGVFTVSTTPAQFSTTLGNVQKITLTVIPGFSGKIFIGGSSLNTSTYVNCFKVLFPNSSGGHSEEFTLEDKSGTDGINTSIIYIAGGVGGETILWRSYATGVSSSLHLTPFMSGPFTLTAGAASSLSVADNLSAIVHVAVIPGMVGKVRVGSSAATARTQPDPTYWGEYKILYPNTGNVAQHNAHSETFEDYTPDGQNGFVLWRYAISADVSGEYPLVTVWKRQ